MDNFDFVLINFNENNDFSQLKEYLSGFGSNIQTYKSYTEALQYIVINKSANVIIFDEENRLLAQQFIVEASQKKIMNCTNFYLALNSELDQIEKTKMMTLGFMGFIKMPFNAVQVQNAIDITDLYKVAG